jgi:hypothetical protein
METPKRQPGIGFAGFALVATTVTGVFAWIALFSPTKEPQALCLVAAALAFGLLSNALWRR